MTLIKEKDFFWQAAQSRDLGKLTGLQLSLAAAHDRWCEQDYHYKGREISEIALRTLAEYKPRSEMNKTTHASLVKGFELLRDSFWTAECNWKRSAA